MRMLVSTKTGSTAVIAINLLPPIGGASIGGTDWMRYKRQGSAFSLDVSHVLEDNHDLVSARSDISWQRHAQHVVRPDDTSSNYGTHTTSCDSIADIIHGGHLLAVFADRQRLDGIDICLEGAHLLQM